MYDPSLGFDPTQDPPARIPFDPRSAPDAFEDIVGNYWTRSDSDSGYSEAGLIVRFVTSDFVTSDGAHLGPMERDIHSPPAQGTSLMRASADPLVVAQRPNDAFSVPVNMAPPLVGGIVGAGLGYYLGGIVLAFVGLPVGLYLGLLLANQRSS